MKVTGRRRERRVDTEKEPRTEIHHQRVVEHVRLVSVPRHVDVLILKNRRLAPQSPTSDLTVWSSSEGSVRTEIWARVVRYSTAKKWYYYHESCRARFIPRLDSKAMRQTTALRVLRSGYDIRDPVR